MTRRKFVKDVGCLAAAAIGGTMAGPDERYASLQTEIDHVTAKRFEEYLETGNYFGEPALKHVEEVFDKVLAEVKATVVAGRPAIWLVYNMGLIVKTPKTCFSVDLMHRRAFEMAPFLDFALISHNHGDHFTESFYRAMNGAGKTVISNFKDNYGVADRMKQGGYTRAERTFEIGDVAIRTSLTDHNDYLVDFTTAFEIAVGDFVIFHSGDCSNLSKLRPHCKRPDLWVVHPRCGMNVAEGVMALNPKTTVIGHLNELGHDRWRWSWADGLEEKRKVEQLGHMAILPLWGERV